MYDRPSFFSITFYFFILIQWLLTVEEKNVDELNNHLWLTDVCFVRSPVGVNNRMLVLRINNRVK